MSAVEWEANLGVIIPRSRGVRSPDALWASDVSHANWLSEAGLRGGRSTRDGKLDPKLCECELPLGRLRLELG
jgi:hypothetical protein